MIEKKNIFCTGQLFEIIFSIRTKFELGEISRPEFLVQVRQSMKMVEEASNCKSCIKIERKLENGETLSEEQSGS